MDTTSATHAPHSLTVVLPAGDDAVEPSRRVPTELTRIHAECAPVRPAVDMPSGVFQRSRWQSNLVAKVWMTDFVVVLVAVTLAKYVRFGATSPMPRYLDYVVPTFSVLFALTWMLALGGFRTRSSRLIGSGLEEYRRVIAASFWTFGVLAIVMVIAKIDIARGFLAVALPVGTLGLVSARWAWRLALTRQRVAGRCRTAVLVFGDRDAIPVLVDELTRDRAEGYVAVGIGMPGYGPSIGEELIVNDHAIPIVGDEMNLLDAIRTCGADTVAIAGSDCLGMRGIRRLMWDLEPMGVDLIVSTGAMDVALSRLVMKPVAGLPMLHIEKPQYRGSKCYQKRAFDFCFSLGVLLLMSPAMALTAIAVKTTSRGPVFYSSERIGIDGKPFSMLKFRTMVQRR